MTETVASVPLIDGLQYANWSATTFAQIHEAGLAAIHVTIAYHGGVRTVLRAVEDWKARFLRHSRYILHGLTTADIRRAQREGRCAIIFGFQNCLPIEDDIGLIDIWHTLGVRFMQLSYNNQSLLATGCYEAEDTGITRMGRAVIAEMNRVGMAIDMSHSAERSTLEAIDLSARPITISHANPAAWHDVPRNKSATVLKALAGRGGLLGLSLYPLHLRDGSACTLQSFCRMAADTADLIGAGHLGIGSDLCQDQPDSVVEWMRNGTWTRSEGGARPGFPPPVSWFCDNRDFPALAGGLRSVGFSSAEVAGILGGNWLRFMDDAFGPHETAEASTQDARISA